jgi:hypothetical protein
MSVKTSVLIAASLAALAAPAIASAQSWGGWGAADYNRSDYSRGYGYGFSGYPQFRDEKAHIRAEIRQGLDEGWLDQGDAGRLYSQLRWVQQREAREFREHGWSLPSWDQQAIRSNLDQIDHQVDQARDQDGDRWSGY